MIVIKVEMWPGGDASKAREIERGYLYNDGGTDELGNYEGVLMKHGHLNKDWFRAFARYRSGSVRDYPRLELSPWCLVLRFLKSCFPEDAG